MTVDGLNTQSVAAEEQWKRVFDKVFEAVVVLRTTSTRDFDTEFAGKSDETGFIVDKKRGIILTNRHVVSPGPVVADATFLNGQEIPVYPLYRDPIHDFGFFRFDPAALEFMKCEEIPLAPEAAAVGLEIRVVGNNSGEKLSVMAGTLARLDTEAPHCGLDVYNDFNTFYMQAASVTQRGSSGSPAIDCHGQAVGLNAGGRHDRCAAYFLPLDRVVRALRIIQKCKDECNSAVHIPRGTLQMTLVHRGFDEASRLGLQRKTEQRVRGAFPTETGLLVIDSVVPGGPADKKQLKAGDLLVRVNGEIVTHFLKMEILLDDNVGKTINLEVERGGVPLKVSLAVQDLHSITPDYFLEVSGGVIHPLSYQQARNFSFRCCQVYVAYPGYMLSRAGVPSHAIIKKLKGKEVRQVQDFITIFSKLSPGAAVPLEFVSPDDPHRSHSVVVKIDRHEWYAEPELYTRDDATGLWKRKPVICSSISSAFNQTKKQPLVSSSYEEVPRDSFYSNVSGDSQTFVWNAVKAIEPTLVWVETHIPPSVSIDGVEDEHFSGTGVVIYHSETMGIVVVDQHTVPFSISDVTLEFAAHPMEIHGDVVFVHPVHNYALVAYDPVALGLAGSAAVHAAFLCPESALHRGDVVNLVGLNQRLQAESQKTRVMSTMATLKLGQFFCPRYRAINMEVIELCSDFGNSFSGVLADNHGRVQALWSIFSRQEKSGINAFVSGFPIYSISEVLQKIISGTKGPRLLINGFHKPMPLVRFLGVELYPILLSKARSFGLTEKWATKLAKKDPARRQVLRVKTCFAGSRAERVLKQGDMLLAIDGEPITSFRDIENACQRLDLHGCQNQERNLRMAILRQGMELELLVGTDVRDGFGTTHIVGWCGCVVQVPHLAVASLGFFPKEGHGVYVSTRFFGTPVHRYELYPGEWIVEINGKPTPDLQTFVDVTKELENEKFVRLKTIELNGNVRIFTLKQDLHYWPTWELIFDPDTATWRRKTIRDLAQVFKLSKSRHKKGFQTRSGSAFDVEDATSRGKIMKDLAAQGSKLSTSKKVKGIQADSKSDLNKLAKT